MARITFRLNGFLRQFAPPSHLREDDRLVRLRQTAEAVNSHIEADIGPDGMDGRLDRITQSVIEKHRGREWPNVSVFVTAANSVVTKSVQKKPEVSAVKINAKRVMAGEPVGDYWIYGGGAVDMIKDGEIADEDLAPYRSSMYFSMEDVWGKNIAKDAESEFITRHKDAQVSRGL